MITAYLSKDKLQAHNITKDNLSLLKEAVWIDVLSPIKEEEAQLNQYLGFNIPTREEMLEIEISSRLYKTKDALFMTASMIAQSESLDPKQDAVTFVFTKDRLITVRYIEPQAFKLFVNLLNQYDAIQQDPAALLTELLDATIDRLADILETVGHRLEGFSKMIFRSNHNDSDSPKPDYQFLIQQVGINADLNTKIRECLVTLSRLIPFFTQSASDLIDSENQKRLKSLSRDIAALSDHATFISAKVNFLLDATLGMINIEQNAIIKIFSVAAVIFLPPTLIASIYGMNFESMPELSYKWGYLFAIALMLLSALIPYKFFKWKKWL